MICLVWSYTAIVYLSSQPRQMNLLTNLKPGIKTGKVIYLEVFGMGKGKKRPCIVFKKSHSKAIAHWGVKFNDIEDMDPMVNEDRIGV